MMYKKTKGFSLAELLISLLIISIVLAAAIPTITKRRAHDPENVWNWTNQNNSAFFGAGHNQTAIIGYDMMPSPDFTSDNFFDSTSLELNADAISKMKFQIEGDKLLLVKRFLTGEDVSESFRNSHISFYNIEDRSSATTRDLIYAGRIASDQHNIAFGIGSLLNFVGIELNTTPTELAKGGGKGYNTALGHYTLSFLNQGALNTAVGESTLTYNSGGNSNTATGAFALNTIKGSDNTAIGANAGKYIDAQGGTSSGNTLVGAHAMAIGLKSDNTIRDDIKSSNNTAIGTTACGSIVGDYNICIGKDAGAKATGNILEKIEDNYGLYIGQDPKSVPIISGHIASSTYADGPVSGETLKGYNITEETSKNYFDKELNVNAKYFRVKTFDGGRSIFEVEASAGDPTASTEGYATTADAINFGRFGRISMALKDIQGAGSAFLSISGSEDPSGKKTSTGAVTRGIVNMYAYDPSDNKYIPLNISDTITISQEEETNSYTGKKEDVAKIYSNDYVLVLNDTVRVEKGKTTKKPFIMVQGDTPENQALRLLNSNDEYLVDIYRDASNSSITISPAKFSFGENTSSVTINGKDEVIINSDNVWFNEDIGLENGQINLTNTNADVKITGLALGGGSIKSAITQIKEHMDNIALHSQSSDARLKNISGDSTAGLKEINALEVKNYTYKKDEKKTPHVGVIAQQLQKVFPNSVFEDEDGYLKIRTEEIFYAMVNSIKELFAQIQDLTAKVVGLDKRITELEQENAMLKKQNAEFEKRLSKLEAKMAK